MERIGLLVPRQYNPDSKKNINGPTVIEYRLPFPTGPKKIYLMYFADHKGKYIRVAWSLSPERRFRKIPLIRLLLIWNPFSDRRGHVASPEVLKLSGKTFLFTHSPSRFVSPGKQITYFSRLRFGVLCFFIKPTSIPSYARFFQHNGTLHAITNGFDVFRLDIESLQASEMKVDKSPLLIPGTYDMVSRVRHPQVIQALGETLCFYTRVGDSPERIFVAEMIFSNSSQIGFSAPLELLRPEEDYEGADIVSLPSKNGRAIHRENALRDPFVGQFGGQHYLYYSTSGEKGIACAELDVAQLINELKSS